MISYPLYTQLAYVACDFIFADSSVESHSSPVETSPTSTEGAPVVASPASSPATSPVPTSEENLAASSGVGASDEPSNLTGARKRKAHRVVKREVSHFMHSRFSSRTSS